MEQPVLRENAVNLFPLFLFLVFMTIGLKYLFRGVGDYELANLSGFIGIVLFFIARWFWAPDRRAQVGYVL